MEFWGTPILGNLRLDVSFVCETKMQLGVAPNGNSDYQGAVELSH